MSPIVHCGHQPTVATSPWPPSTAQIDYFAFKPITLTPPQPHQLYIHQTTVATSPSPPPPSQFDNFAFKPITLAPSTPLHPNPQLVTPPYLYCSARCNTNSYHTNIIKYCSICDFTASVPCNIEVIRHSCNLNGVFWYCEWDYSRYWCKTVWKIHKENWLLKGFPSNFNTNATN